MAVFAVILTLLVAIPSSRQFRLIQQNPEKVTSLKKPFFDFFHPEDVTVKAGTRLTLLCGVDDYYEWCTFTNPRGESCNFEWKRSLWNVTSLGCHLGGGARFVGNYGEKQCGLEVDIGSGDSGGWSCEIEQYRFGGSRGSGYVARGGINIDVTVPTTKATVKPTTTTTSLLENTTVIVNIERRGKSIDVGDEPVLSRSNGSLMTVIVSIVLVVGAVSIALLAMLCHRTRSRNTAREVVVATVQKDMEKVADENAIDAVYDDKVRNSVHLEEEMKHLKKYFPHVINFPAQKTSSAAQQMPKWPKSL